MYSLRHIKSIVVRLLAIVTMTVALGCVLLPELDSFSWEQSYSKSRLRADTFITAFFDGANEDTDGDGSVKIWLSVVPAFNHSFYSLVEFSLEKIFPRSGLCCSKQKFYLLHRKLLL